MSLRDLLPADGSETFFGVDRSVPTPSPEQVRWWRRRWWERGRDWLLRRREPPGPRLAGWRMK